MREKQAEFDPAVERIVAAIDPKSSVSVSTQLRGALEFGIASGELPTGQKLPSVRMLAKRVGISPVTVSHVYASLQSAGHIEGRAGSGTFVRGASGDDQRRKLGAIDDMIGNLLAAGREAGLSPADLSLRVAMAQPSVSRGIRILMVGNFHDATESYANDLRPHLSGTDTIDVVTLEQFDTAGGHDLIIGPRTLLPQIRERAPDVDAVAVTLIPNEATRVALAGLTPDAKVVGYSYFPGFVTIMKTGIQRFAPHVSNLSMVVRGDADEAQRIAEAEVVIYASGAGYLNRDLADGQAAFEYRHTPDVQSIRSDLLPAIEACRRKPKPARDAAE